MKNNKEQKNIEKLKKVYINSKLLKEEIILWSEKHKDYSYVNIPLKELLKRETLFEQESMELFSNIEPFEKDFRYLSNWFYNQMNLCNKDLDKQSAYQNQLLICNQHAAEFSHYMMIALTFTLERRVLVSKHVDLILEYKINEWNGLIKKHIKTFNKRDKKFVDKQQQNISKKLSIINWYNNNIKKAEKGVNTLWKYFDCKKSLDDIESYLSSVIHIYTYDDLASRMREQLKIAILIKQAIKKILKN